jgi:NAD(P)H-hydrate epimerase
MKIASSSITREIDKFCIEVLKIPGIVLMENAALKIIKNIDFNNFKSFLVLCGTGNNGGDGFAVARHLFSINKNVEIFFIGSQDKMTSDCRTNYNILKNMDLKINKVNNLEDANELKEAAARCDMCIDALFGTGITRNIEGIYDLAITIINENSKFTLSIDIPSGLNGDTGEVMGNCIKSNKTVTFQYYKRGFLNYGNDKYTGEIIVEDIGIPKFVEEKFYNKEFIVDKTLIKNSIKIRDKYSHKGDYGRVLIIAGSKGFTGASYICTEAAVRSGAGLVTLACNEEIQDILSSKLIEAMTISYNDETKLKELIQKSNAIAIGPGLGNNAKTFEILKYVILNAKCPVIIDADGINMLKDNLHILKNKKGKIIITPHVGEMSRITGFETEYINEHRIEVSKKLAQDYGIIVLLKGYNTVITDGEYVFINSTGNSSMASGGMGDCLTGIIASFIAQKYEPLKAAYISAFIHGYTGEKLSKEMFCVNASHVLESIPYIIKKFQNN